MASATVVDREKTAPFCMRAFVKIGGFHRLEFFEDGLLPTTDEHQIFTWRDATLKEVLTTLRLAAPHAAEIRNPLAKVSFRTLYADSAARGRIAHRDLGTVYSRDILGEPGSLTFIAPRLLTDHEEFDPNMTGGDGGIGVDERDDNKVLDNSGEVISGNADREDRMDSNTATATGAATAARQPDRSLDELRFVPGDYMCVSVVLPKHASPSGPQDVSIRGAAAASGGGAGGTNGWKNPRATSPPPPAPPSGLGRGGGHWRGGPDFGIGRGRGGGRVPPPRRGERERDMGDRYEPAPPPPPYRGGFGGRDRDRERDRDRDRVRERGRGDLRRNGGGRYRSRSASPGYTPPLRRRSRYD